MQITDELLNKYFKGQCSLTESKLVEDYLKTIDEWPENLINYSEWVSVREVEISEEKSEELFYNIKQKINNKSNKKWITVITAAASLLFICVIGMLIKKQNPRHQAFVEYEKAEIQKEKIATISWKSIMNYTNKNQTILLPDHSIAEIEPESELRYSTSFNQATREVYLKGKGTFNVVKDQSRPFVVYAKGISTTALGTSFIISAFEKTNIFKVVLLTGKILVKNTNPDTNALNINQILIPGSSLICDFTHKKYNVIKKETSIPDRSDTVKELVFSQTPLVNVFDKLQQAFHVEIIYIDKELKDLAFTGNIKVNNNLKQILKDITELNNLKLKQMPKGYQIKK